MPKMVVAIDGVVIKEVPLTQERTTVGRRPYNDVVIDNLAVSGEHAVFVLSGDDVLLHDLGKGRTPPAEWPRHIAHEHRGLKLIDAAPAVARQTLRVLAEHGLVQPHTERRGEITYATTGSPAAMARLIAQLGLPPGRVIHAST